MDADSIMFGTVILAILGTISLQQIMKHGMALLSDYQRGRKIF